MRKIAASFTHIILTRAHYSGVHIAEEGYVSIGRIKLLALIPWVLSQALSPIIFCYLLGRLILKKETFSRLGERRGRSILVRPPGPLIWIHSASIGESKSVQPLVLRLQKQTTVLLTTGTLSAQTELRAWTARENLENIFVLLKPLDVPSWIKRFLHKWKPDAGVFVESELWPNTIAACRLMNIPLCIINARLSSRTFARWARFSFAFNMISESFKLIDARSLLDCARFHALAEGAYLQSSGDMKFSADALPYDRNEFKHLVKAYEDRPVWIAASTHVGEEQLLQDVHNRLVSLYPSILTVIVPRHPDLGPRLARRFRTEPRSRSTHFTSANILIADTFGELGLWYRLAPIAFVGRSLVLNGGGQNFLEAARLGCAVAVGPNIGNFTDHARLLSDVECLVIVRNATELADYVDLMLSDSYRRRKLGERSAATIARQSSVVEDIYSFVALTAGYQIESPFVLAKR